MVMIVIAVFSVTSFINKGIYLLFLLFEAQTEDAENFTRLSALKLMSFIKKSFCQSDLFKRVKDQYGAKYIK